MLLNVFSIFDVKSDAFLTPFFFPTKGQAIRAFKDLANDAQSTINRHPEDYKLCHVGTFHDDSASFESSGVLSLGFATDYLDRPSVVSLKEVGNG